MRKIAPSPASLVRCDLMDEHISIDFLPALIEEYITISSASMISDIAAKSGAPERIPLGFKLIIFKNTNLLIF